MGRTLGRKARARVRKGKITKKNIKSVVKTVMNNSAETKHYITSWSQGYFDTSFRTHNLTYGIPQGTSGTTRIGDKIYIKGVSLKVTNVSFLEVPVQLHYAFVASDVELAGVNNPGTATDFIKNSATSPSTNWRIDPERCSVMKRGVINLRPGFAGGNEIRAYKSVYCKFKKQFQYNPNNTFAKFKNFYIITWGAVAGGGLNQFTAYMDFQLYFTDV